VPYRDRRAFIANAVRIVSAPGLLARIRRTARNTVLPLDWGRVVERFESVLMRAAAEARPADRGWLRDMEADTVTGRLQ
jgi:hypothetical protein